MMSLAFLARIESKGNKYVSEALFPPSFLLQVLLLLPT